MRLFIIVITLFQLFACQQSKEVVSRSLIQKRKYTKGLHFRKPAIQPTATRKAKSSFKEESASNHKPTDSLSESSKHRLEKKTVRSQVQSTAISPRQDIMASLNQQPLLFEINALFRTAKESQVAFKPTTQELKFPEFRFKNPSKFRDICLLISGILFVIFPLFLFAGFIQSIFAWDDTLLSISFVLLAKALFFYSLAIFFGIIEVIQSKKANIGTKMTARMKNAILVLVIIVLPIIVIGLFLLLLF